MAKNYGPDLVQKILQLARPTFVNRRWRKPYLSGRKLAAVRRELVMAGVEWPRPLRDRGGDKPLKLARHERERAARQVGEERGGRGEPSHVLTGVGTGGG